MKLRRLSAAVATAAVMLASAAAQADEPPQRAQLLNGPGPE